MLTVQSVSEFIRRRLDGDPSVPVTTLCNQAGGFIVDEHTWGWLVRTPASLNLVSGRPYITLPDDFGRAIGKPIAASTTQVASFEWMEPSKVLEMRGLSLGASYCFYGYIGYALDTTTGTLKPRIELSASPTESQTAAFKLPYFAAWTDVTSDSETLVIPSFLDAVFLQIVMAFAQGYDEAENGSREMRLQEIKAGMEWTTAKRRDGAAQPSIGMMSGGAAARWMPGSGYTISHVGVAADPT